MPAGRPKTTQCMVLFEKLEAEGIIHLPSIKHSPKRKLLSQNQPMEFDTSPIEGEIREFEPLHLEIARPGEAAFDRWKAYINQYHLLEYKIGFGSRLQYFIKSGDMELGCSQFSASAWALEH